jgi:anti-sigma regulatory factor (Ser/Thr protein kinase)
MHTFIVKESSQIGETRRKAVALAGRLGFNEAQAGKVGIVITEVAGNLLKHAEKGEILLSIVQQNRTKGIQILALDKGPGMKDVGRCLHDGTSTINTLGTGMGAIMRLSTIFDIYSIPGAGTVVLACLWPESKTPGVQASSFEVGGVCRPVPGETACGDIWAVDTGKTRCTLMVADGLGHGPEAAEAALQAEGIFYKNSKLDTKALIQKIHFGIRDTRGAAGAVARIDLENQEVYFAGVGNISGTLIFGEEIRHMISYPGILGHRLTKNREYVYPFPTSPETPSPLLIMHSDGLKTKWNLSAYPGLVRKTPSLIAGVLYRDYKRNNDDATIIVARHRNKYEEG